MTKPMRRACWSVAALAIAFAGTMAVAQEGSGYEFPIPRMTRQPKDLQPFRYIPAKIPYYAPGGNRSGGDAWNRMQLPLPPEESRRHIVTPVDFEVRLFASEPDIVNPICMAWDERGRLWIAETIDYPNDMQPPGKGRDRIKICEDTDGDGRADKFTIFADKLSIPTSLCFSRGGVIVHQAPHTLFLKDTDGDDRADVRKVLFSGWGIGDTHAGPSNLHYGFDNWIWGVLGYSGFRGKVGNETHAFGQGIYRFKADGSKLEFLRSTNNNTWGLGFSEEGIVFASTANRNPSVYMPIPNRYYEQVRGLSPGVLGTIAESHLFRPITKKVRQVDHHGGFTAGAGHALYTARTYPQPYWNRTAFVCGPTGHLVGTFVFKRIGAGFRSKYLFNLFASDDEWTAPIMAEVGPDGHVWVIDWYNYIVQHNPTPVGFKRGKGNAYIHPLRDKKHARIYRVVYRKAAQQPQPNLAGAAPEQLVRALKHPNMLWRKHAQRLLVERGRRDVVPQLIALVNDPKVDAVGLNAAAIHALWTLEGLGVLGNADVEAAVRKALNHPSAGVRRNAVMVLPRSEKNREVLLDSVVLTDRDAQVRLAAILALSEMPVGGSAGEKIVELTLRKENSEDRWIRDALIIAAARHDRQFLAAAGRSKRRVPARIVAVVAEHFARGRPDAERLHTVLAEMVEAEAGVREAAIAGLAKGWPKEHSVAGGERLDKAVTRLFAVSSAGSQSQLIRLASRWGGKGLQRYTAGIAERLLNDFHNRKLPEPERLAAARQLVELRPQDAKVVAALLDAIHPQQTPDFVAGIIDALGNARTKDLAVKVIERFPKLTPKAKSAAVAMLLSRLETTGAVLDALAKGKISPADLSLNERRMLLQHPDRKLAARARRLLAKAGGVPDPDREKVLRSLYPLLSRKGDPKNGKLVFKKHCSKCHRHSGEGADIAPDLTGMAVHSKEELLTNIIDPSRSVEGNYRNYVVLLKDGKVISGLLSGETRTTLELLDTEAKKHTVLREDIEQLAASTKSFMPDGFEKQMSNQELVDLLEFLTRPGKYIPLDLRKIATISSDRGMFYSEKSTVERLILPDWKPRTFAGVPFHFIDPRGGRVPNVVMLYGPLGKFPPRMPKRVGLDINLPVKVVHLLSGVSGWGAQRAYKNGPVAMIVRIHYEDGVVEDHPLRDGEHFADYIRRFDVPGSKFAFQLRGQQMRYLAIMPKRPVAVRRIEFIKGPHRSAPVIMAATIETRE